LQIRLACQLYFVRKEKQPDEAAKK
jgi:hypothetical protein